MEDLIRETTFPRLLSAGSIDDLADIVLATEGMHDCLPFPQKEYT
jgi:hypothetical protein